MTEFLLFLIFLAPTIQYRVELRAFSFAVMEPVVLLASGILILRAILRKETIQIPRTWPEIGLIALVAWALLIRPWSQDWKHGLSDIRDWVIPVVTFLTLRMTVRQGWRKAIGMLIAVIFLTAAVGVYQEATDSFRPFKSPEASMKLAPGSLIMGGSGVALPFAVGFFAHPNSMGLFLCAGFILTLAWATHRRRYEGWLALGVIGLALIWTYAKASYIVLVVELGAYFLLRWIRSLKVLAGIALISIPLAAVLLDKLPSLLLSTLATRYALWTTAVSLLVKSPHILLFGNGMDPFGEIAFYFQPHNTYIYILLDFGLLGLGLVLGVVASIALAGWRDGREGLWERDRILQAAWIAALSFFAVGMAESVLLGIELRMIVLTFLACYLGLRQELRGVGPARPPAPVGIT